MSENPAYAKVHTTANTTLQAEGYTVQKFVCYALSSVYSTHNYYVTYEDVILSSGIHLGGQEIVLVPKTLGNLAQILAVCSASSS